MKAKNFFIFPIFVILLFSFSFYKGQKIKAQELLENQKEDIKTQINPLTYKIETGVGYNLYGGNQDSFLFQYFLRGSLEKQEFYELEGAFNGLLGYEKKERNKNRHGGFLNYDQLFLKDRLSFFYFGNILTDESLDLSLRTNQGLGVKYKLVKNSFADLSLSVAPIFDYEKSWDSNIKNKEWRWSIRPRAIFYFDQEKNIQLRLVLFYIPLWDNFKNYRLSFNANLKVKIAKHLFLEQHFRYDYDSHPITNQVKKSNTFFSGSLGLCF